MPNPWEESIGNSHDDKVNAELEKERANLKKENMRLLQEQDSMDAMKKKKFRLSIRLVQGCNLYGKCFHNYLKAKIMTLGTILSSCCIQRPSKKSMR